MMDDMIIVPLVNPGLVLAHASDITGVRVQRLLQPRAGPAGDRLSTTTITGSDGSRSSAPTMGNYVLRRLAITPLLLLGIVTLAFIIARIIPADPVASIVGERNMNNEAVVAAAEQRWGLDGSIVHQYFTYLNNLLHGDLGTSFRTKQSVTSDLWERLPATAELALAALFVGGARGHRPRHHVGPPPELVDRPRGPLRRARRLVAAGVLARPDRALHAVRPARVVPRSGATAVPGRPAAARHRDVRHRRAPRRRPEPGLAVPAPADAPGVRARLEPDGHRLAPRARRDARRDARRLRAHGAGPRGSRRVP